MIYHWLLFSLTDDTFISYCGIYITPSHKQVNLTNHVARLVHINIINARVTDCDASSSPFRPAPRGRFIYMGRPLSPQSRCMHSLQSQLPRAGIWSKFWQGKPVTHENWPMNWPDFAALPAHLGWPACNRHTVACMHRFSHILRWPPEPAVWFMFESGAVTGELARI